MDEKKHFKPEDLVIRWGVPLSTLSQWRWNGRGPYFMKLGKHIVYRRKDVEMFEEQKVRKDTTKTGYVSLTSEEKEQQGGKNDYRQLNSARILSFERRERPRKKHL